jgi:DNA polymerase-3 subunit epsilon
VRQKLYEYLLERPAGAAPRELLDLIFTQPGADPEFGPRFLGALLAADARFVLREADGTWHARVHEVLARRLDDTTFVVVDLETTGLATQPGGIIEIGAARLRGGRVLEEFQQLVNPGMPLPRFITRLTGIDDAMLAGQPRLAAVWPSFRAFLGDDVIVAHNARFDVGFLNAAALLYDGGPLTNPQLCTIKLARRLLPGVRRRGLDALAAHFTIPQADRHRALGDVRITVEVFFQLLERMKPRGIARLDQALDLQHSARDGRRFECFLRRDVVERLPAAPGTYQLLGADGGLLYVGKAKNLRERVSSYLANAEHHSNKTLDLIRHAHDVRVQVTGSELEAALEEAAAIRRLQPPYNRLGKHLPRIAFVKLALASDYPRLMISTRVAPGRARYIGPFRNRAEAERVVGLLTRLFRLRTCAPRVRPDATTTPCFQGQVGACSAPCAAGVDRRQYAAQVDACLQLLSGDSAPAAHVLAARRDRLSAALRFEAAARLQRDLHLLQRLVRRQRLLGWVAAQHSFLILQPDRQLQHSVFAYVVLSGRLALRTRVYAAHQMDALADQVAEMAPRVASSALRREEVDGTTILAAWLRDRGETDGCVLRIDDVSGPATQRTEWRAACASLLAPPADRNGGVAPHPEEEGHQHQDPSATAAVGADRAAAPAALMDDDV